MGCLRDSPAFTTGNPVLGLGKATLQRLMPDTSGDVHWPRLDSATFVSCSQEEDMIETDEQS